MAIIGVEGVEIRIYKAEELILTLTTDPEGRADTMLEADTYRVEYWFEDRKVGEHDIILEVDSHVVWSFPAILMAVIRKLPIEVEVVEVKLGDVVRSLPVAVEVEVKIVPEFYPPLEVTVETKLGDVVAENSLVAECIIPPQTFPTASLTQTVNVKLGDVALSQTLVEAISAA